MSLMRTVTHTKPASLMGSTHCVNMRPISGVVTKAIGGVLTIKLCNGTTVRWTQKGIGYGDKVLVAYDLTHEKVREVCKLGEEQVEPVCCGGPMDIGSDLDHNSLFDKYEAGLESISVSRTGCVRDEDGTD